MSMREGLKKIAETDSETSLVQALVPADLLIAVDAQIERDRRNSLDVSRKVVIIEAMKEYLRESGKPYKGKKAI